MNYKNNASVFRPRYHRFALESRQLFDGAAAAEAVRQSDSAPNAERHDTGADAFHSLAVTPKAAAHDTPAPHEVYVVDTHVENWSSLVNQLPQGSKVVVITTGSSGLAQLDQALANDSNISAIHIISHGGNDKITLGSDEITAANVADWRQTLNDLGSKMAPGGDILLYGCDVAQKDTALIAQMATLTHSDVAASSDDTGSSALGGNWTLEASTGHIDTRTLVLQYDNLLATPTLTNGSHDLVVAEPSTLFPGAETGQLSGWQLSATDSQVTVEVRVSDTSMGSLSNGSQSGTDLTFTGSVSDAQAWLNQIHFTASDKEYGDQQASTHLDIFLYGNSGFGYGTQNIIITPSNDPATIADSTQAIPEVNGSGTVIGPDTLAAIDPDYSAGAQTAGQLVYSLNALPQYGYLTLNGQRLGVGSVFTQQDVINGSLRYVHTATGADQDTSDSFSASLNDGATPIADSAHVTVTLTITPENQPPTVQGSGSVYEGQPQNAVTTGNVGRYIVADGGGDPQDTDLTLTITSLPAHGTLYFDGKPVTVGQQIDYADRDKLTYSNDGQDGISSDSFGVRVTDQGGGGGTPASSDGTITLHITSVDDDPVLDPNSTLNADVSQSTSSVTLTPGMLNATDVDSPDDRISFIINDSNLAHGYFTLNGMKLQDGDSFTLDDVKAGRVVFVQDTDADFTGQQDSFDFQVIDHSTSVYWDADGNMHTRNGGIYDGNDPSDDLSHFRFTLDLIDKVNGDSGNVPPYDNTATENGSTIVGTDVNNPNAVPHGIFVEGGAIVLAGTGAISDAAPGLSYVVNNIDPGQVVYTWLGTDPGQSGLMVQKQVNGVWVTVDPFGTFTQADLDNHLIRFAHDGNETFIFNAHFQATAGQIALDAQGKPQPITWNPTMEVFVTPVNDAPVIGGSANNVLAEGATLGITAGMMNLSDPDDADSGAPYETSLTLNGHDNYALNNDASGQYALKFVIQSLPTGGVLQYLSAGNWVTITAADIGNLALDASLLTGDPATTGLRFVSDGSEVRSTSFSVSAQDRWGLRSVGNADIGLIITPVNDGPKLAAQPGDADPVVPPDAPNQAGGAPANNPLTVVEGSYGQITSAMLQAYDPDNSADQVQYTLTRLPGHGTLAYSTDGVHYSVLGVGSTFSQDDINRGYVWYLNDGVDQPGVGGDNFGFTLSDGDKEQSGNRFDIIVSPANDAPSVISPGGTVDIGGSKNAVPGFSVDDPDLDVGATNVTDAMQVVVRLLHNDGTPFSQAEYQDVTLAVASVAGLTVSGGNQQLLVLNGTVEQINAALAGLTLNFATDRNQTYRLQVISDDRSRDAAGNLSSGANGGPVNAPERPTFGTLPGAVDTNVYDWYHDAVPVGDGNIAAATVNIRASQIDDPGHLSGDTAKTTYEDQPTFIGGNFVVSDIESNSLGLPVTLTLTVAQGTLGIGGNGAQSSLNGVTISGDNSGRLVLTGKASDIQALLNDPTLGLTYLSELNANHDQNGAAPGDVTLNVHLDTSGAAIGQPSGSAPADLAIALTIVPVNDAPTVSAPSGTVLLDNSRPGGSSVPGFVVGDIDVSDAGGIAAGENDHVRVTIRISYADGTPFAIAQYRDQQNSAITITSGNTNSGVTIQTTSPDGVNPPSNGQNAPLVIDGTVAQVNAFLAQLQVTLRGINFDDANQLFHVDVIVDDRNRNANGALSSGANGGDDAAANGVGTAPVPQTEIDPYGRVPDGLTQNVAIAWRQVLQSAVNNPPQLSLGDHPAISTAEGSSMVTLPPVTIRDVDAIENTITATVTLPPGFTFTSAGSSGATVSGLGTSDLTLTGSLDQINVNLAHLSVQLPDVPGNATRADWNGSFGVVVRVNDQGNSGSRPATLPSNMTDPNSDPGQANYSDGTSGILITTRIYTFTVTPVNDAPVVSGNGAQSLPPVAEDTPAGAIAGTNVGSLFAGFFDDSKDTVDNSGTGASGGSRADSFWGIAVSSLSTNPQQGAWQYSLDNGATWQDIGNRSDANALFLDASAQLRFVPAANYFGTPATLGVRLVENNANGDTTSTTVEPVNGATGNTSVHGGTSRYSNSLVSLTAPVTNVNDRPALVDTTMSVAEDSNAPSTLGALLAEHFSDTTDNQSAIAGGGNASGSLGMIAIYGDTTDAGKGHWEYLLNGTWTALPQDISVNNALVLSSDTQVRFVQLPDYYGAVNGGLQLRASDTTDPALTGGAGNNSRVNLNNYISDVPNSTSHWSNGITLGVAITAVKDINNDTFSVHAGKVLTLTDGQLLANDTFENPGRAVTSVTQPGHGTIVFANGQIVYTPSQGYVGSDSFTYTVTSGGVTETATVTINVTNTPPVATPDNQALNEDSPTVSGNLLTNDSDADGDALTVTTFTIDGQTYAAGSQITLSNFRGTLQINADGSYSYTPVADWNGSLQVSYRISDGNMGGEATSTLTLTVNPVVDIHDDVYFTHAGNAVTGDVLANDTFSNPDRTITAVSQGAHGRVTITADQKVLYQPDPGYVGTDSYTYTVTSGGVTETATVTVIMTNTPPPAENLQVTTPEDTSINGNLLTNLHDTDGDALSVTTFTVAGDSTVYNAGSSVTIAGKGTLTIQANGDWSFIPVADWNGTLSDQPGVTPAVSFTVSDGNQGGVNTSSLDITVTPVQDIANDNAITHAGKPVTIDALANDTFSNPDKTITATGPAAHGSVAIVNNQLVYTPAAGYVGNDSFTYTVTSGGVTETALVTVVVTNAVPTTRPVTTTTPEDHSAGGNLLSFATDADGDALSITTFSVNGVTYNAGDSVVIAGQGTLSIQSNGDYLFTPIADWNGSVSQIAWTVSDGNQGGTAQNTLSITVTPVVDIHSDISTTHSDTPVIIPVLSNDTFSGTALTVTADAISSKGGTIEVLSDNTVRYTPPAGYIGFDTFHYSVTSGGITETAIVVVGVTNNSPVTNDTIGLMNEDGPPLTGQLSAVDPDGDPLQVLSFQVSGDNMVYTIPLNGSTTAVIPGVGSLTIGSDMSYSFTPLPDWNGNVPDVQYQITDNNDNGQTSGLLKIIVNPVVDIQDDSYTLHAGTSLNSDLLANDSFENPGRQITAVTQGAHGSVQIQNNGTVTYTPDPTYVGTDSYTYTVTSNGTTETATVYVTIDNRPPLGAALTNQAPEDNVIVGTVIGGAGASDPDGDTLRVTTFSLPGETTPHQAGETVTIAGQGDFTLLADGSYRFVPIADWNGTVPVITWTVSDGHDNGEASGTLNLTITPVADIKPDNVRTHSGVTLVFNPLNNDTFSNPDQSITAVTNGSHGQVTIVNGQLRYVPTPGFVGTDTFTYTVTSGGINETATVTVTVWNTPPVALPDTLVSNEDSLASGNVLSNDKDLDSGDVITVTGFTIAGDATAYSVGQSVTLAGMGVFTLQANGDYTFRPVNDWNGVLPVITYAISDGNQGGTAQNTLRITISPVRDAMDDSVTTHAGVPVLTNVLANDTFSNPDRTISSFTQGAHGSVALINGRLLYVPAAGYVGTDSYTYTVTSGGVTETATVTVNVTNTPPTAVADSQTLPEDTVMNGNVLLNDRDADGDALHVSGFTVNGQSYPAGTEVQLSGYGTLTLNADGSYVFTPVADWNGSVPTITYTITDGNQGGEASATLSLTLTPVQDAMHDDVTTHASSPLTIDVLANDTFSNPDRQLIGVSHGAHGITAIVNGRIAYIPDAGYVGQDTFSYRVLSGGIEEVATVTVTMVNAPPVTELTQGTLNEDGGTLSGTLHISDTDHDALQVTDFTVGNQTWQIPAGGSTRITLDGIGQLTLGADGSFSFTPNADWNGSVPLVSYHVTDHNANGTTTGQLALVVTPVADIRDDYVTLHAGGSVTTDVLANDTFSNPDKRVSAVTQGAHGQVRIDADGRVTYQPQAGYVGSDSYTYTVTSGGVTETATVYVTITNLTPQAQPDRGESLQDHAIQGNVLSNDSDADGDALQVTSFTLAGDDTVYRAGSSVVLEGRGTFTLNADGSYLFTPVAGWNGAPGAITYTVSDGRDNGSATTTLTLLVKPVAAATVSEAALLGADHSGAETGGQMTLLAFDSIQSLTINDSTFTRAQLDQIANGVPLRLTDAQGVLEIRGYRDSASGQAVIQWHYTLSHAVSQPGESASVQRFTFTINGDVAGILDITTLDDVPSAVNDQAEIVQDRGERSSSGNLLGNDRIGADGSAAGGAVTAIHAQTAGRDGALNGSTLGAYGTLRLDAQGNWRYDLDPANPAVAALAQTGMLRDVFVYTITDGDGDTSQATLTIVIYGTTPQPNVDHGGDEILFDRRTPGGHDFARRSYDPGLFILPLVHAMQRGEHPLDSLRNDLADLGYGADYAGAPVLELGIGYSRWLSATRPERPTPTLESNGLGQNLLWDAFGPFSVRQSGERDASERHHTAPRHAVTEKATAAQSNELNEAQVAPHEEGATALPIAITQNITHRPAGGAPSLSAQLARLNETAATEHSIALPGARAGKHIDHL